MSQTGLGSIDTTLHKTRHWITEVMEATGSRNRRHALGALRAGLHELRDHLPLHEVAALGAQLPVLIRGYYYEGWQPERKHGRPHDRSEVLRAIVDELPPIMAADAEKVARSVYEVVRHHVDANEIDKIASLLPPAVRELWEPGLEARGGPG